MSKQKGLSVVVTLLVLLGATLFAGCPASGLTFTFKIINTGQYPLIGAYVAPDSVEVTDWGPNRLRRPLATNEYVLCETEFPVGEYELLVQFDVNGTVEELRLEPGLTTTGLTEGIVTWHGAWSDTGNGTGYFWGNQTYDGEMKVPNTPQ